MPMGKPFPVATTEQPSEARRSLDNIHAEIRRMREEAANQPAYVPPPLHPTQIAQTKLEQEEGRRQVALREAEQAKLKQPEPVVESTPAYRPPDYVPDMKHGYTQARTIKG